MNGKPAGTHLTVIIRDDSPMMYCGDTPAYRRVTIGLTVQQVEQLELKVIGNQANKEIFESASHCFLEE